MTQQEALRSAFHHAYVHDENVMLNSARRRRHRLDFLLAAVTAYALAAGAFACEAGGGTS